MLSCDDEFATLVRDLPCAQSPLLRYGEFRIPAWKWDSSHTFSTGKQGSELRCATCIVSLVSVHCRSISETRGRYERKSAVGARASNGHDELEARLPVLRLEGKLPNEL